MEHTGQEEEKKAEDFLEARTHSRHRGNGAAAGGNGEGGPGSETLENCDW